MGSTSRFRKMLAKLYNKNPYCPKCGVFMILPEDIPDKKPGVKKNVPDNMCTYEHSQPRCSPYRLGTIPNKNGILCKKCNEIKGYNDEIKYLGIDGMRVSSGRSLKTII